MIKLHITDPETRRTAALTIMSIRADLLDHKQKPTWARIMTRLEAVTAAQASQARLVHMNEDAGRLDAICSAAYDAWVNSGQ